ncbi:Hcp1 family type VI secretion system effector (plasmid) [Azospirillum argentinense]|uniref:Hcp1 family type VI secretion system effector n=1 Tax=Azospirillum argentinense TaxID=2970906 RepID=A0A2K1G5F5_9PROT|nr:type VI secretion system tube protein Hcp [Azospirillum argentinense]PNQ99889.1 Hcp1 family type VI secretion system effector [Azospirillum argentinense]
MAIYVKIDGIEGDATHESHKKWVDIGSMQFGVGRAISTPSGRAANREASEPSVSEITLTRELDKSSPLFFKEAVVGKQGKKVQIDLVTTGDPGETYMTYELENTLVSGYSVSANGQGRPSETISLNFSKITMSYTAHDAKNAASGAFRSSYDLATTKAG